jgi:hypothetical protein
LVLAAACLTVAVAVVGVLPGVGSAAERTVSGVSAAADQAAADRAFVRYLAGKDARSPVRTDAWVALMSSRGDEAVAEFLATGFDYAKSRAAQTRSRNLDFAKRVLATNTAEYAPEVHRVAQRAVNGSDADRDVFVRTGYAAAQQADRVAREVSGELAKALVKKDWDYVLGLSVADPGPQVRGAAAWASRTDASDTDIIEFFAYGWASAARFDIESNRTRNVDADATWRVTVRRLIVDAQAAEQAAVDAAAEAAAAAKAAAARAWQAVGEQTSPPRSAWTEAQSVADRQAVNWQKVLDAANNETGPNWQPIVEPAIANQAEWTAERDWAADRSRFWDDLLAEARAGESRMAGAPA